MAYIDYDTQYTGKRSKVGAITFDKATGAIRVVIGYCPCEKHKILVTLDEARFIAHHYNTRKRKLRCRLFCWILHKHLIQESEYRPRQIRLPETL